MEISNLDRFCKDFCSSTDFFISYAMELARVLDSFEIEKPYLNEKKQLEQKTKQQEHTEEQADLPKVTFTARLMAHYRAQENNRDDPLIIDPYAKSLAGDLKFYLKNHIRASEMDYPLVRSNYIEQELLIPWCESNEKSQIILLGAGLDTRAFRFKPLKTNSHIIFEIDLPEIIEYKEKILENETPLCELKRLSLDLSEPSWENHLIQSGFSKEIPTFWIIEGLLYYIEKKSCSSLLSKATEISQKDCHIFLDLMQRSRWFESDEPLFENMKDPFSRHFKWGIDLKLVPTFLLTNGWDVSCFFADDYDQGRDVGQRAMIYVQGKLK
ncbi:MAG: class I SAM-dependent methyltransferase [Promethearchaeota archaeon]